MRAALPLKVPEVVQLSPANITTSFHLISATAGVGLEHAFTPSPCEDLADRKRGIQAAILLAMTTPSLGLQRSRSLPSRGLGPLPYRPGTIGNVLFELLLFDFVNDPEWLDPLTIHVRWSRVMAPLFYARFGVQIQLVPLGFEFRQKLALLGLNARSASSLGRFNPGAPQRFLRRQRRMAAWSPPTSTAGTAMPSATSGRVYSGSRANPAVYESCTLRVLVAQHARQQPRHGIRSRRRGQLPAAQHEVAQRELGRHLGRDQPFVEALVTAETSTTRRRPPSRGRAPDRTADPARSARAPRVPAATAHASRGWRHAIGSYFSTMPGPPPYGRSSTADADRRKLARRDLFEREESRSRARTHYAEPHTGSTKSGSSDTTPTRYNRSVVQRPVGHDSAPRSLRPALHGYSKDHTSEVVRSPSSPIPPVSHLEPTSRIRCRYVESPRALADVSLRRQQRRVDDREVDLGPAEIVADWPLDY